MKIVSHLHSAEVINCCLWKANNVSCSQ